jgi:hypothetical protein
LRKPNQGSLSLFVQLGCTLGRSALELPADIGARLVHRANETAASVDGERSAMSAREPHVRTIPHEVHELRSHLTQAFVVVSSHPNPGF